MIANEIIQKLKTTPYKFTYAHAVRDEIKKMEEPEKAQLLSEFRMALTNPKNEDIRQALREIFN